MINYIFLFSAILFLDRFTKYIALNTLTTRYILNKILAFELVFNRGVSWGFFSSFEGILHLVVKALILLMIFFLGVYAVKRYRQGKFIIGEVFVLAGAVSNFVDRIIFGGVVDFIVLWPWPNFNIADIFIVFGVLVMFMGMLRDN